MHADAIVGPALSRTARARFRRRTDVAPVGLQAYWALHTGAAELRQTSHVLQLLGDVAALNEEGLASIHVLRPQLFCLNDDTLGDDAKVGEQVTAFLETYFP